MKKYVLITLATLTLVTALPMPKAHAIDPITIAVLAPVAMKAAEAAAPYAYRGLYNAGKCLFLMGKDLLEMFYLPYGLGYMCFGSTKQGMVYMMKGGVIAPGKFLFHTLMLPLMIFGLNINI